LSEGSVIFEKRCGKIPAKQEGEMRRGNGEEEGKEIQAVLS
jgi:hypothetical protein